MDKLKLAFSPCPNDTFIFDALVHKRIDLEGLDFEVYLADIDELNQLARKQAVDVCKVSFYAYARYLTPEWQLLESGAALGRGCGPLLVQAANVRRDSWREGPIAIPGEGTTAHFLLRFFAPETPPCQVMVFNEIMPAVAAGRVAAGVIIHESRFVYTSYGLKLVQDLGEYWEAQTGLPIPLGGIVARRNLGQSVLDRLERVVARSVQFALKQPDLAWSYIQQNAQELEPEVIKAHIALYVNEFTLQLGHMGKLSVERLVDSVKTIA